MLAEVLALPGPAQRYALTRWVAEAFPGREALMLDGNSFGIGRHASLGGCRLRRLDDPTPLTIRGWNDGHAPTR